jgi:hypothetical protein
MTNLFIWKSYAVSWILQSSLDALPQQGEPVGDSSTVEPRTLTPLILVRIQVPQPRTFQISPGISGFRGSGNSSRKFRTLARRRLPRRGAVVSFLTEGITPQQLEMLAFEGFYAYATWYLTGESRAKQYRSYEEFNAPGNGNVAQIKILNPWSAGG